MSINCVNPDSIEEFLKKRIPLRFRPANTSLGDNANAKAKELMVLALKRILLKERLFFDEYDITSDKLQYKPLSDIPTWLQSDIHD